MVDTDRLTEIVRDAYENGAYGSARFVMAAETHKALAGIATPPDPDEPGFKWPPKDTWARLTAIPVMLDNSVPVGAWRLLDRDGRELERGGYPDRRDSDWHKLHPEEYESAVAEAAGALAGAHMARGEDGPMWTETFLKAFRAAVEVAFCWGYSAAKGDDGA